MSMKNLLTGISLSGKENGTAIYLNITCHPNKRGNSPPRLSHVRRIIGTVPTRKAKEEAGQNNFFHANSVSKCRLLGKEKEERSRH